MPLAATKKKSSARARAEWKPRRAGGLQILESPALAKLDWLVHGFSTRAGGASEFASSNGAPRTKKGRVLNLGFTDWDSRARVLENRKKFFHAIGADKLRAVTLRQIHSDVALRADASGGAAHTDTNENTLQGDALFTRDPGILLVVQTADCIPILLADTTRHAIAAIHAGWRGTLRRIAAKTLGRMQMEFGTRPEDVIAALGPGIGRCCYEVGSEVARDFDAQFPNAREWFDGPFDALASGENDPNWLPWLTMKPPGHQPPPLRVRLDLIAANCAILAGAGIPARQISSSGLCTACRTDLLFSYRGERTTGRMMAAIGIR
jgi:polyphenol oxidase